MRIPAVVSIPIWVWIQVRSYGVVCFRVRVSGTDLLLVRELVNERCNYEKWIRLGEISIGVLVWASVRIPLRIPVVVV